MNINYSYKICLGNMNNTIIFCHVFSYVKIIRIRLITFRLNIYTKT